MRIIFLNSLEKQQNETMPCSAQVWIGEEEGIWRMGWNETIAESDTETIWYEGASWSEMLHVYRHQLAIKLSEGYRPVLEGIWDGQDDGYQGRSVAQKLLCYSDMHPNEALYSELSLWRRKKAAELRKPPYMIASNRLLKLISVFRPLTNEELMQLPGVGAAKAAEYGQEWIVMMASAAGERPGQFPLDWVDRQIDDEVYRAWIYRQKEAKFRMETERIAVRRKIMDEAVRGSNLDGICTATGLQRRELVEWLEVLEKDGYSMDDIIGKELEGMAVEDIQAVWDTFEELGDQLLKPVLQRLYTAEAIEATGQEMLYERLRLIRMRFRRERSSNRKAV
ncbi:HRDC domain-containing protein [Paenibacillus brevis]|uniref:HRDC domain-containing protein n=1 Tax=Paenibacillus brevis TaxID=2841508 RepID=A0ABS6FNY8_9BACL|nr:HRDC domain-containing protein [Paenibacillus brevis]MBU5671937.1 HRDC domain-containing protein [Paenibacillus brevis]